MGDDWKFWKQAKLSIVIGVLALLAAGGVSATARFGLFGIDVRADELTGKVLATVLVGLGFVVGVCSWPLAWGLDKWCEVMLRRNAQDYRREGFDATADLVEGTAGGCGAGCIWMLLVLALGVGGVYATIGIWSGAAVPWGAAVEEGATSGPGRIHLADGFTWMRLPVADAGAVQGLPVAVTLEANGIRCRRLDAGQRILVLTYQGRGERAAYGVYALLGAKRDLLLDFPLEGDPIGWPDRDHASALTHQLTLSGLDDRRAEAAVRTHAASWFEPGLRVFLLVPRKAAEAVQLFADVPQGADGPRLLLVVLDLPDR